MSKQLRIALFIEVLLIVGLLSIGLIFWHVVCDETMKTCFSRDSFGSMLGFLLLSAIRPLVFSPLGQAAYIAGDSFGLWLGTFLTALGAAISALILYFPGHLIGKKIVRPWLTNNLPSTWRLIRTQDYKLIFISRWIPIFPFDIFSLLFGVADFHARQVFFFTFLGVLPEVYFFASIGEGTNSSLVYKGLTTLSIAAALTTIPLLLYEFVMRKRGASLWTATKKVYYELLYEARTNNDIVRNAQYSPEKIPIVLLYGFFSSRKTLAVMEKLLTRQGYEVMSFNLGGSLGVFFTRGIPETAEFIDRKIQRQMKRYGFEKVHVVAHSKGGLVALYWLLKNGGAKYCDKVITMGTPYKGTWLTYLAIFTPLGFFWKDVWQMRPGCSFLRNLHEAEIPKNLKIHCLYSKKDSIAIDTAGVFQGNGDITAVPMHHLSHFQFLARRDVASTIGRIIRDEPLLTQPSEESLSFQDETVEHLDLDSHKSAG
ncbi:MAG: alpha/beta fold hydrolase [Proteobacteria bacterium]|nr:MAG: alpha/beta fold hydrolase [Pseudomonadota bacterium]